MKSSEVCVQKIVEQNDQCVEEFAKVPSSSDSALIDVEAGISEKKNRKQSYWCCSKGRTRQQSFCVN